MYFKYFQKYLNNLYFDLIFEEILHKSTVNAGY